MKPKFDNMEVVIIIDENTLLAKTMTKNEYCPYTIITNTKFFYGWFDVHDPIRLRIVSLLSDTGWAQKIQKYYFKDCK
jgi:hypothetical protein